MEWRREPAMCRMAIWIQAPTASVSAGPFRTGTRWEPMSSMKSWAQSATTSSTSRTFARYVGAVTLGYCSRTWDGLLRAKDWFCLWVMGEKDAVCLSTVSNRGAASVNKYWYFWEFSAGSDNYLQLVLTKSTIFWPFFHAALTKKWWGWDPSSNPLN